MTVMKFVQLFILKKKLRESMVAENNNCYLNRGTQANDLLDLTCLNCKEKYSDLLEKLRITQSFTMLPKVSAFPYVISSIVLIKNSFISRDNIEFLKVSLSCKTASKMDPKSDGSFLCSFRKNKGTWVLSDWLSL